MSVGGKARAHARSNSKKEAEEEASRQALNELSEFELSMQNDHLIPLAGSEDPGMSALLPRYSVTFRRFLDEHNLSKRVRWFGQDEGEAHCPTWKFIVERKDFKL